MERREALLLVYAVTVILSAAANAVMSQFDAPYGLGDAALSVAETVAGALLLYPLVGVLASRDEDEIIGAALAGLVLACSPTRSTSSSTPPTRGAPPAL